MDERRKPWAWPTSGHGTLSLKDRAMKFTPRLEGNILTNCTLEDFDYQVDPYLGCGHYCYYCYVLNQAETDWTREVLGYKDIKERLSAELSGISPQTIYLGWRTDPYQPIEADYQQTRRVLELLLDKGFSASILTKSNLVLRDVDLLKEMPDASVSVSVAFNDDRIRRLFEHQTMETEKRISALIELKTEGIRTSALVCPIMPYITDAVELVEKLENHTEKIWLYGLSILDVSEVNWQQVKHILEVNFPEVKDEIEAAVFSKDHSFWVNLKRNLVALQATAPLNLSIHF